MRFTGELRKVLKGDRDKAAALIPRARTLMGVLLAFSRGLPQNAWRVPQADGSVITLRYFFGIYIAEIFVPVVEGGVPIPPARFIYRILPGGVSGFSVYNEWYYNDPLFSGQSADPHDTTGRVFAAGPRWAVVEENNRLRGSAYTWFPANASPGVTIGWEGSSKYIGGFAEWVLFSNGRFLCYAPGDARRVSAAAVQNGWLMVMDTRNNQPKTLWIRPFRSHPQDADGAFNNAYDPDTNPDGWRAFPISGIADDLYRQYGRFNSTGTQAALVYLSETHSGYYTIDIDIQVEDGEPDVTIQVNRNDVFPVTLRHLKYGYKAPAPSFDNYDERHDTATLGPLTPPTDARESPLLADAFFESADSITRGGATVTYAYNTFDVALGDNESEFTSFAYITSHTDVDAKIDEYVARGDAQMLDDKATMEAAYDQPHATETINGEWVLNGVDDYSFDPPFSYTGRCYATEAPNIGITASNYKVTADFSGLVDRRRLIFDQPDETGGDLSSGLTYTPVSYHADTGPPTRVNERYTIRRYTDEPIRYVVFADYVNDALEYGWIEAEQDVTDARSLSKNIRDEYVESVSAIALSFRSKAASDQRNYSETHKATLKTTTGIELITRDYRYSYENLSTRQGVLYQAETVNAVVDGPAVDFHRWKIHSGVWAELNLTARLDRYIVEIDMTTNTVIYKEVADRPKTWQDNQYRTAIMLREDKTADEFFIVEPGNDERMIPDPADSPIYDRLVEEGGQPDTLFGESQPVISIATNPITTTRAEDALDQWTNLVSFRCELTRDHKIIVAVFSDGVASTTEAFSSVSNPSFAFRSGVEDSTYDFTFNDGPVFASNYVVSAYDDQANYDSRTFDPPFLTPIHAGYYPCAVDKEGNALFSLYDSDFGDDKHMSALWDAKQAKFYDPFTFWPDGDPNKPAKPGTSNQADLFNIGIV